MNGSHLSNESDWRNVTEEEAQDKFSIPKLPNQFLLVSRIIIVGCGLPSNVVVVLIFFRCRRLHLPRHTCWMAVTLTALLCLLFAAIELIATAYPTRSSYTFLLLFKGTPFAFFSLGYCLVAVERYLAVSHYLWYTNLTEIMFIHKLTLDRFLRHKDHVTNRVVLLGFASVGLLVVVGVLLVNCFPQGAYYFMPGNGVSTWKLLLLGLTVMMASIVGIVLQFLTYSRVRQLYRAYPTLRQTDRHLLQIRYQQPSRIEMENSRKLHVKVTCAVTTSPQYSSVMDKPRASRLDLEAGFYYFIISIPVLVSNGVTGLFLTFNYFCSLTEMANDCHRFITVLLYIRTFQLFVTACNPVVYFSLSSEFRSAWCSKFTFNKHTKA